MGKAQVWYTDFMVGVIIFVVVITLYFVYAHGLEQDPNTITTELLMDAKSISNNLVSAGSPVGWNQSDVQVIGLTDNSQRLVDDKVDMFFNISYIDARKSLRTSFDFFVSFEDLDGNPLYVDGFCGVGSPDAFTRFAYYYVSENFMLDEMLSLGADVFKRNDPVRNLTSLLLNIDDYDFILMEDPGLHLGALTIPPVDKIDIIQDWVSDGNILFYSEDPRIQLFGNIYVGYGVAPATVIAEDPYLTFDVNETITFDTRSSIMEPDAVNFLPIVTYKFGKVGVARWDWGDGLAYYFSDFDADYEGGIIEDEVFGAISSLSSNCENFVIDADNVVRIDRVVLYNSNLSKMVVYVWD